MPTRAASTQARIPPEQRDGCHEGSVHTTRARRWAEREQCARLARHDPIGLEDDQRQQRKRERGHGGQQRAERIDALHAVGVTGHRLPAAQQALRAQVITGDLLADSPSICTRAFRACSDSRVKLAISGRTMSAISGRARSTLSRTIGTGA